MLLSIPRVSTAVRQGGPYHGGGDHWPSGPRSQIYFFILIYLSTMHTYPRLHCRRHAVENFWHVSRSVVVDLERGPHREEVLQCR